MANICSDYRDEMRLLALRRQLADEAVSGKQREIILAQICQIEKEMKMA